MMIFKQCSDMCTKKWWLYISLGVLLLFIATSGIFIYTHKTLIYTKDIGYSARAFQQRYLEKEEEVVSLAEVNAFHHRMCHYFFPEDPTTKRALEDANLTREAYFEQQFAMVIKSPARLKALQFVTFVVNKLEKQHPALKEKWQDRWFAHLIEASPQQCRFVFAQLRMYYLYILYSLPTFQPAVGYEPNSPSIALAKKRQPYPQKSSLYYENGVVKMKEGAFDYVIVGTGPGASVIGAELAKQGYHVAMIEAGPFIKPGSRDTTWDTSLMESYNTRTSVNGGINIRSGQGVGGGTLVNVNLAFPPSKDEARKKIANWIQKGHVDPRYVHYEKIREDYAPVEAAYAWVEEMIGTRKVRREEVNPNNELLLLGSPNADTYYLNAHPYNPERLEKISAVDAFLWPILNGEVPCKGSLSIIPNTKATNLQHDGYEVKALMLQRAPHAPIEEAFASPNNLTFEKAVIKGKHYIICGGALGSPELLLRAKIPNKNIGKGLVLHPSIGVAGIFPKKIDMMKGLNTSVYAPSQNPADGYFLEMMGAEPNFVSLNVPGNGKDVLDLLKKYRHIGGIGVMLVDTVNPKNKVFLDENGNAQIAYELSEPDKKRLQKGLIEAATILFSQGAEAIILPSLEYTLDGRSPYIRSLKEAKKIIQQLQFTPGLTLLSSAHMQASNKMGANPKKHVVSQRMKVWNQQKGITYKNLFVVDASAFPTSIGVNPMQGIYTMGKLFVDFHLLRKNNLPSNADHYLYEFLQNETSYGKFNVFLSDILQQISVEDFDKIIQSMPAKDNRYVYEHILTEAKKYKGNIFTKLSNKKGALATQRQVLVANTKKHIGARKLQGVAEIGSPGAYLKQLKQQLAITGKSYVVHDCETMSQYAQNFSFAPLSKFRSYNQFVPLSNYDPISEEDIPSNSLDLVVCYIGLHHIPPHKLRPFLASIHRILKPNGRFVLREHNANTPEMWAQAAAAHSIFNAISDELSWREEENEIRVFKSLAYYQTVVEQTGLIRTTIPGMRQAGDPTQNTLVSFVKPPLAECQTNPHFYHHQNVLQAIESHVSTHEDTSSIEELFPNLKKRAFLQTFMTSTEWFNVWVAESFAKHMQEKPYESFPFGDTLSTVDMISAQSYNTALTYGIAPEELNGSDYTPMDDFIRSTMKAEYYGRALIAKLLPAGTKNLAYLAPCLDEYASFLSHTPFFLYSYSPHIWPLYKSISFSSPRQCTRDVILATGTSTEFTLKSLAGFIVRNVGDVCGDDLTIDIVVQMSLDEFNALALPDELRQEIQIMGNKKKYLHLRIPRYLKFKKLLLLFSQHNIAPYSIAGNKYIQITVMGKKEDMQKALDPTLYEVCYGYKLPGSPPDEEAFVLLAYIPSLDSTLDLLTENQLHIQYIHDF